MKRILLSILSFLLLLKAPAFAQSYYFKHYQVENGLSNNSVLCSVKDKKGFLWFGTKDGLNRFDGYNFKTFRYDPRRPKSIGDDLILSVFEDKNEILWVGTDKGIYLFDPLTETFSRFKNSPAGPVYDIKEDGKGSVWFICRSSLVKYNRISKTTFTYNPEQYFSAKAICITPGDNIWIATADGSLRRYVSAANSFLSFDLLTNEKSVTSRNLTSLCFAGNSQIMIGTQARGVFLFDINTKIFKPVLTSNTDRSEIFVKTIIRKSEHEFWIGSETGLYIFNDTKQDVVNLKREYNNPYSLSDNSINTFCLDNEGGIWAGTYYGGLSYYPYQYFTFEKFFPKIGGNSISGSIVGKIVPDKSGKLWIGTEDAGINRFDPVNRIFTPIYLTKQGIDYRNIRGMAISSDTLWVGTYAHGLCLINVRSGKIIDQFYAGQSGLKSNYICTIYKLKNGELLFCTNKGLYLYNSRNKNFVSFDGLPSNVFYTSVLEDTSGILWIGTFRRGLYRFDPKTKKLDNFQNKRTDNQTLSSDRINTIFQDSKKNIWIGTDKGLSLYLPKTNNFMVYTMRNGFPSDLFCSITEDKSNTLWLGTSKGLAAFEPASGAVKIYTRQSGVLSNQFNYNSVYKSTSGQLYFGGLRGMIRFDPSTFEKNTYSPPVYFTNFFVQNKALRAATNDALNKPIIFADTIRLDYTESTFSIEFAALSFTSPNSIHYAYKMSGLDKNWNFLRNNRKAYFTKVLPGKYTFRLKATNSGGIWNEQEKALVIIIHPPFWRTTIAYITYLLLFTALLAYLYYLINRRNRINNERQLKELEAEKEKEANQARIEYFTQIAHEVRTPLTLISGPMETILDEADQYPKVKKNLEIMDQNVKRLLDLTNQLLDFRKTEIKGFSLDFVKTNINELLEKQLLRFKPLAKEKNIVLNVTLPEKPCLAYVDAEAVNKIVSNLFNNAIKYAAGLVYLKLGNTDTHFTVEFRNDGYIIPPEMKEKIFETFFRLKETRQKAGTGIGLALAKSLAELQNGTLELDFSHKDLNCFVLILPINQIKPGS